MNKTICAGTETQDEDIFHEMSWWMHFRFFLIRWIAGDLVVLLNARLEVLDRFNKDVFVEIEEGTDGFLMKGCHTLVGRNTLMIGRAEKSVL